MVHWLGGTLEINTNGGDIAAGGVALAGDTPKFDNVKIGYDNNSDDDIDDAGDDLVLSDAFDATTVGFTYDDNGNLTDDGTYKYTYDAWNRLVEVTASSDTDIVIQAARFDGLGRRVRKVVTNSGELDGTTVYYHNGNQIIETRDGSGDLVRQMYHGTQYIDELVGLRIADLGRLYVHQDANYNVVALSDMSGRFVERVYYSPYGKPEFVLDAHPFDYDDDGDVDASDIAAATTGGDCWGSYTGQDGACKRLDANADRDIDADDHTAITNYVDTLPAEGDLQRTPSSTRSNLTNAFAHQGLVLDPEIGSYQNRARQYAPTQRRFMQRDPLTLRLIARSGYQDGMSLFGYVGSNPFAATDFSGLIKCFNPDAYLECIQDIEPDYNFCVAQAHDARRECDDNVENYRQDCYDDCARDFQGGFTNWCCRRACDLTYFGDAFCRAMEGGLLAGCEAIRAGTIIGCEGGATQDFPGNTCPDGWTSDFP